MTTEIYASLPVTSSEPAAGVGPNCAEATGSAPAFHRWRIRKELPDGMFSCCEYNAPFPVTAEHVRTAPSVVEWLGKDTLDEIYHPQC